MDKILKKKYIAIRCDLDFGIDLKKGVPNLIRILNRYKLNITFYVTMGPDSFWKSGKRVKKKGYIKRLMNLNPIKMLTNFDLDYLIKTFFLNKNVGEDYSHILNEIIQNNHELGVHGYDHYKWAENIFSNSFDYQEQSLDFKKAILSFKNITNQMPSAWASPNWRCDANTLKNIDKYNFKYSSDCRGDLPFFPKIKGKKFNTLQIPINLPCLHEIRNYIDKDDDELIRKEFLKQISEDINVWCIHGYYEGILKKDLFQKIISDLKSLDYEIITMIDLYENIKNFNWGESFMKIEKLPGGRGGISYKG